jgi:hypothetical protein
MFSRSAVTKDDVNNFFVGWTFEFGRELVVSLLTIYTEIAKCSRKTFGNPLHY